ncbi:MAG: tRNA epoxyqueuosine(34) reductase QueG [Phycisphaerae bacterium]|nr:tRNA epoxyqueuosine(34) reductase QueG [Phycisphaerae bacterium]
MTLAQDIKHKALQLGFDLVAITDASPLDSEQFEFFTDWLSLGYAARMDYMRNNLDKRTSPAKLLDSAQSVICLALNYTPPPRGESSPDVTAPMGKVANYAQYEDYHPFVKKQLRQLTDFISSIAGVDVEFKICVDSAPLAERALTARAGLGFIGKNHMLINPRFGSQLLLAEIVTTLSLPPDKPIETGCANCNKCLAACPTGALRPDGQFDANKCISYLTIEYKGDFPPDLSPKIGNHLFGCDECVLACPYNADAPVCKNKDFRFFPDRAELNLRRILDMTEDDFETEFADSPFLRLGLERLKRNAQTCLNNL